MEILPFKNFNFSKNVFPIDENGRKIDIYKFEICECTGLNLYYPNLLIKTRGNLILPLLERTMSLNIGTIYDNTTYNHSTHIQA